MANPQLSVVIPAYNEERVIRETVEAVERYLHASRVPHEILVVDDGSADRTVEIAQALAREIPSVRLLQSGHAGGAR